MSGSIALKFFWPMGHRILGLDGLGAKCTNIHGHSWIAEIEIANKDLELEFGAVKAAVEDFIESTWDHGFMLDQDDPFLAYLQEQGLKHAIVDGPPTTERVAEELAKEVTKLLGRSPLRVYVQESYRNAAAWSAE